VLDQHLQELLRKLKERLFSKGNSWPTAAVAVLVLTTSWQNALELYALSNYSLRTYHMGKNPPVPKPKMLENNSNNKVLSVY